MVAPRPIPMEYKLTGKTRHRVGFRGRLILQVQVQYMTQTTPYSEKKGPHTFWRDATTADLAERALNALSKEG